MANYTFLLTEIHGNHQVSILCVCVCVCNPGCDNPVFGCQSLCLLLCPLRGGVMNLACQWFVGTTEFFGSPLPRASWMLSISLFVWETSVPHSILPSRYGHVCTPAWVRMCVHELSVCLGVRRRLALRSTSSEPVWATAAETLRMNKTWFQTRCLCEHTSAVDMKDVHEHETIPALSKVYSERLIITVSVYFTQADSILNIYMLCVLCNW